MVASAKNEQDQNSGTGSMLTMPVCSQTSPDVNESFFESKDKFTSNDDYAPKVRKPYTITKQRERWTEDEHLKFIEALKLHGRAWKRIEEHVGTKTAVQIRSHAQKFFTKVVRESSSGEVISVKADEIPPPRPKRKPVHPYPRKLALSGQRIDQIVEKPVRSASMSPCLSVLEHENRSPTSVLSAVDTSEANSPNGSLSPVSSATDVHCGFSTHSVPDRSSPDQENSSPSSEEESVEKLLIIYKDNGLAKKVSADASSSRCLKLFGKTMIVPDSHTESMQTVDVCKAETIDVTDGSSDENSCSASANNSPFQKDSSGYVETPFPWWTSSESLFTSTRVYSPIPIKPCMMPDNREAQYKDFRKEGSSSGSNTESRCLEGDEDRKSEIEAQSQEISLHTDGEYKYSLLRSSKTRTSKCRTSIKGFVPYKRCVADKGFVPYSSMVRDEGIEQRIRLSL